MAVTRLDRGAEKPRALYELRKELTAETDCFLGRRRKSISSAKSSVRGARDGFFRAAVKPRYRHPGAWANVAVLSPEAAEVNFESPQASLSMGQSAVFYDG